MTRIHNHGPSNPIALVGHRRRSRKNHEVLVAALSDAGQPPRVLKLFMKREHGVIMKSKDIYNLLWRLNPMRPLVDPPSLFGRCDLGLWGSVRARGAHPGVRKSKLRYCSHSECRLLHPGKMTPERQFSRPSGVLRVGSGSRRSLVPETVGRTSGR
ncbi:uncharacterized protein CPUR_02610 [Claviceps purpurea 20.1]|uniref:Uncharacterized protein n=1 Tax=Claviceps purpurea (strain 20.1) TaxID=1111077 RepID=M1W3Z5_CLAP2|nr:uncharacterized protein CPUR_02610 [Claviceps purpurea 20.1]